MKRCPKCNREYDVSMSFCLDDGTELLYGPSLADQHTEILPSELKTRHITEHTGETSVAPMSSAEYLLTAVGRNKFAATGVVVVVVSIVAGVVYLLTRERKAIYTTPRSLSLQKVTTDGKSFQAAISPDGKYAVYNVDEGGAQSLWTRQIATSSPVQIISPIEGVEYQSIRFTPDGNFVTFLKRDSGSSTLFSLYQMPVLGGTQKKLATDVDGAATFSPDAKMITYLRGNAPETGESSLLVANADGSNERILARRKRPETFPWWPSGTAEWSPDGKSIATVIGGNASGSIPMHVAEVNVEDGSVHPITKTGWYEISQVLWLPDKSGLLVMGALRASDFYVRQIYLVSYPTGEMRRITADFNNYVGMSLTADGKTLLAVQGSRTSNLWSVPNADAAQAVQIKSGGTNLEGVDGLAAASDGRIIFYSKAGGNDDIWIMNADGSGVKQLTADVGANYSLNVTRDDRYILFTSERAGQPNIWRMDLDGANPKQLTFGKGEWGVSATSDSKWFIYDSADSGVPSILKMSIDGGEPVPITNRVVENGEISNNAKYVVCQFKDSPLASWRWAIFNVEGGDPIKILNLPGDDVGVRWGPDDRSLIFLRTVKGVTNVWSYPIDSDAPKQLTHFKTDRIFRAVWMPAGKGLLIARGSITADIVLINDFR